MTPVLVFDIETVPDVAGLRKLHGIDPMMADRDVAEFALSKRRASHGSDFLPHYQHRIVSIACALRERAAFRIWSLGSVGDGEEALIRRFYDGIEKYTPQLVSWNGGGFDLPVLNYRALVHGICAPRFWEWGDEDRAFGYNNYISRYHKRHIDLMDIMSMYQPRAAAPLDAIAQLCGFPGKIGIGGNVVREAFEAGLMGEIRAYCEADVANTYLLWLKFQLLRGVFNVDQYRSEIDLVRSTLERSDERHWKEFLDAWRKSDVCA